MNVDGLKKKDIKQHPGKRRVFISWYDPDTIELINDGIYQDGDIILNKLVCFGKYDSGIEWGTTPEERAEFFLKPGGLHNTKYLNKHMMQE